MALRAESEKEGVFLAHSFLEAAEDLLDAGENKAEHLYCVIKPLQDLEEQFGVEKLFAGDALDRYSVVLQAWREMS